MMRFIKNHSAANGFDSICRQLPIVSSQYYEAETPVREPDQIPAPIQMVGELMTDIQRFYAASLDRYGAGRARRGLQH